MFGFINFNHLISEFTGSAEDVRLIYILWFWNKIDLWIKYSSQQQVTGMMIS